jgi:signal transduction histidine kinase
MEGVHAERVETEVTGWRARGSAWMRRDRVIRVVQAFWVDIAWVVFVGLNLIAMQLIPAWQTIPFLSIWISLAAVYGFRLWRLGSTIMTVAAVTLATGGLIGVQVLRGHQDADYLAEVPLIALMFVVMVWHARRRQAAMDAMKRVSEQNLRLLGQQRQFLQDASHELATPITVALGHTQLVERAVSDPAIAEDVRVTADELLRLRRLANRLLLLASADGPDFLLVAPVEVDVLALEALSRWRHVPRAWSLGAVEEATVEGDLDRLTMALDELIENAIVHTEADDRIELSVRRERKTVVLAVADAGRGVPAVRLGQIFDRFARVDAHRSREAGGFGLGLAIVKAIAEAHGGSVRVRSTEGRGSVFELLLPERMAPVSEGLAYGTSSGVRGGRPESSSPVGPL